jgi:hypothetical protein
MYKSVLAAPLRRPFLASAIFAAVLALTVVVDPTSPEVPEHATWAAGDISTGSVAAERAFPQAIALAEAVGRAREWLNASPDEPEEHLNGGTAAEAGTILNTPAPEPHVVNLAGEILFVEAPEILPEQVDKPSETAVVSDSLSTSALSSIDREPLTADLNRLFKPEPSSRHVPEFGGERRSDVASSSPPPSNVEEQSSPSKHLTEATPRLQPLSPGQQQQLTKADELVRRGDVAGARLLLEHLLSTGSPVVAFKLAETYDPKRLGAWKVFGLRADPRRADELYQRAQAGGIKDGEAIRWPSPDRTGAPPPAVHLR